MRYSPSRKDSDVASAEMGETIRTVARFFDGKALNEMMIPTNGVDWTPNGHGKSRLRITQGRY